MKALFTIGYYILATIALTIGVFLAALHFDLLPGYEIRIVQSGSMEPELPTGSVVLIQPRDRYEVGDIITFGQETGSSIPTTHRIIGDNIIGGELAYITKGDANDEEDIEPVIQSEVRGKVLFDIPYLGYLLDFARQPLGFALLIGVPAFMIVVEEVSSIYQSIYGRRETEDHAEENPSLDK
jgi:signal peptidase